MKRCVLGLVLLVFAGCGGGGAGNAPAGTTLGSLNTSTAKTSLLSTGDPDCPTGGILVDTGVDSNGNGILDASEVSKSQKVCNGAVGSAGASIMWQGTLSTAPSNPQIYWAYYNNVIGQSYIWDGTAWNILAQNGTTGPAGVTGATGPAGPAGTSLVWKGTLTVAPDNPQNGWAYYNSIAGKSYIWYDSSWQIIAQDGAAGANGTGSTGSTSTIIVWKGTSTVAPDNPQDGWAYYNSVAGKSYIWYGSSWQIIAQDGAVGATGATGAAGSSAAATAMTGKISCYGTLSNTTPAVSVKYEVAQFSSNFILATASVQNQSIQSTGSEFYATTETGYSYALVQLIFDLTGSANSGYWNIWLNRSTLVATVEYHDADLPNGTLTWSISADKCYNTFL